MVRIRQLKYLKMVWDEDRGNFIIITYDRESGEKIGHVVLNPTYMFSVMRFMVSIFQRYFNPGRAWRLSRAKAKETKKVHKRVVQPEAGPDVQRSDKEQGSV